VRLLYVWRIIKHKHTEILIGVFRDTRELNLTGNLTIIAMGRWNKVEKLVTDKNLDENIALHVMLLKFN
jgi:hypothetical protein